jgi:aspartyl-tRNA(Asn)/glutamyl-tRNA(Gln) amidotransferase subunit A
VPWSFLEQGVEQGSLDLFREAMRAIEAQGATIVDVSLPTLPHAIAAYYLVATAEASSNLARFDGVRYGRRACGTGDLHSLYGRTRDQGFGAEVKRRILLGTFALASGYYDAYYLRAQKARQLIREDYERAFRVCDVIATPTSPTPAFRLGEKVEDPLQMYLADIFTVPANLAGLPAVSVPCGLSSGLPVGLQFVAAPFEEGPMLSLALAFETAAGLRLRPPL